MDFPGRRHTAHLLVAAFSLPAEECVFCVPSLVRERAQEAYIQIPPDSAYALFPYDLAVYLYYVTVIYLNHEYNYMLSLLVSLANL